MINLKVSRFFLYSIVISILFGIWSANKPLYLLPDMRVYLDYYNDILSGQHLTVEPIYQLLTIASNYLSLGFPFLVFFYLLLSVSLKAYVIKKFNNKYQFALLYLSSYFLLHELIQIRVGLAISFLFMGCYFHFTNKKNISAVYFLCAVLSHFSTLPFVLSFYISTVISTCKYSCVIPILTLLSLLMAIFGFFKAETIQYIIPSFLQYKFEVYSHLQLQFNEKVNFLSVRLLIFYTTILVFWCNKNKINRIDNVILLNVSIMLMIAFITSGLPSFSLRFFDMVGPFIIFLIIRMDEIYNKMLVNFLKILFFFTSLWYSFLIIN